MSITRRQFIGGVAAAATVAQHGAAHAAKLSFGPASFDVTSTSALIWLRPNGKALAQVEYGTQASLTDATLTAPVPATDATDYTVVIELTGLTPGTEYVYRGVVSDDGKDLVRGKVGRFRTAPDTAKEFRFAWSADMEAGHQPFKILDSVARMQPDFFLMLGDTMYADHPKNRFVASLRHYRYKHRENRDDDPLQRMLAATSVYAIWDDHEVENDFNSTHPAIPDGRKAFREYWPVNSSAVLYRRFSWTPATEFFVLDCRSYRSPQTDAEGPAKTMLGAEQKAWLKESLTGSKATFKFLVSSVPFLVRGGADVWANYVTERRELVEFVHREGVRNLVILSGDFHMALDLEASGLQEFLAGPIGAWPQCQMNAGSLERLKAGGRFFICDGPNYGAATVRPEASPPQIEVQFVDGKGAVRHTKVVVAS